MSGAIARMHGSCGRGSSSCCATAPAPALPGASQSALPPADAYACRAWDAPQHTDKEDMTTRQRTNGGHALPARLA